MLRYADAPISYTVSAGGSITSAVATLTIGTHKAKIGDMVVVSGVGTPWDGTWRISATAATTISYPIPDAGNSTGGLAGTAAVSRWVARSPLLTDSYTLSLSSVTANYISTPSSFSAHALGQSATPGVLNLTWGAPTVTGIPADSETYDSTLRYRAYNATAGFYSGELGDAVRAYDFTGLANATGYWCEVQARNMYRTGSWIGAGGLLQYTRTVRQYGSIAVNAEWSRSYKGTNALRSDAGSQSYHGYYSSNQGLQKSYYGYNWGYALNGASVLTRCDHYINSEHWYASAGGTLDVRYAGWSGSLGWAPASANDGGDSCNYVSWGGRTGTVGYNLNAGKIQAYLRTGITNLILGFHAPSNSTSQSYYGYKSGATVYGTPLYIDWYWDS